ncbi:MAG: hypothetical protein KJ634_01845 [Gammaproteobacteria bacterium]|nr:hypothetical protein [Gammaproteobacteria bacterium]MBU1414341.1 hypothetical protein [Gammaproteobacteria bacterium]
MNREQWQQKRLQASVAVASSDTVAVEACNTAGATASTSTVATRSKVADAQPATPTSTRHPGGRVDD